MVEEGGSISSRPAWNLLDLASEEKIPGTSVSKLEYGVTLLPLVHRLREGREVGVSFTPAWYSWLLCSSGSARPTQRTCLKVNYLLTQAPIRVPGGPLFERGPSLTRRAAKGSSDEITTHLKTFVLPVTFGAEELYFIS